MNARKADSKSVSAMCGQCLDTVSVDGHGPADALGRKMVQHFRSKCRHVVSREFADSLESDLNARAAAVTRKAVA